MPKHSRDAVSLESDNSISSDLRRMNVSYLWHFDPASLKLDSVAFGMPVRYDQYRTLVRATSAIIKDPHSALIQVFNYCSDMSEGEGQVEVSYTSQFTCDQARRCRYATCSTVEASNAVTCYAKSQYYTAALMSTRCLFFLTSEPVGELSIGGNSCWTDDVECVDAAGRVHILEIDVFVEQLMQNQRHPFGLGVSSGWRYLLSYDPRGRDHLQGLVRLAEETRGHKVLPDRGLNLVVCVMADDSRSILLMTLFIDPTSTNTTFKNCLVLDAKRWLLKRPMSAHDNHFLVMCNAIKQGYGIQYQRSHDCASLCSDAHQQSGTHVLPLYEPDGVSSLEIIESEYWKISGRDWNALNATRAMS